MSNIVKVCKVHGELEEKDISRYRYKTKGRKEDQKNCRLCKANNRLKFNNSKKNDPEFIIIRKERNHRYLRKRIERIPNNYVLKNFIKNSKLKSEDVPQELLDLKRDLIRLKRKIKEKTKCLK